MSKAKPRRTKTVQVRVTLQMWRALKNRAKLSHYGVVSDVVLEQLERLVGNDTSPVRDRAVPAMSEATTERAA